MSIKKVRKIFRTMVFVRTRDLILIRKQLENKLLVLLMKIEKD